MTPFSFPILRLIESLESPAIAGRFLVSTVGVQSTKSDAEKFCHFLIKSARKQRHGTPRGRSFLETRETQLFAGRNLVGEAYSLPSGFINMIGKAARETGL
jgi:hypothetical protein